jgi:glycosyltransferase involved in cell wall biosynthesis
MPITLSLRAWGKLEQQTADIFLPVSSAIADANQLATRGVSYRVIPNFIPNNVDEGLGDTDPLQEQLPQGNYLLFVGNVGHDKGAEVLLQAYAEMECQVPLILIGQPEAGFSAAIPPGVRLLQSWPHAAVMSAWRRCTIALMPSICPDACPTVAMEAMAMGRAIVASHIGGLPDIVSDGETGILIPPGDCRALREAIQRLLDDPGLRERLGAMARQKIFKFQAKTVVPRIEQVYREVLHSTETSTSMKPDRYRKSEGTLATPTSALF